MVTVKEQAHQRIKNHAKWLDVNPQFGGLNEFVEWISMLISKDIEKEDGIFLPDELRESQAFRSLSQTSILVYLDFLGKRQIERIKRNKRWRIKNNGQIVYTYEEAEKRGISRTKFRNAIDDLQQKGLIDITHLGKGGRKPAKGETGDVTTYWIDDRWKDYGTDDFKPPRIPRVKS